MRIGANLEVPERENATVIPILETKDSFIGTPVEEYLKKRGFSREDGFKWGVLAKNKTVMVVPFYENSELRIWVEKDTISGRYNYPSGVSKKGIVWTRFENQGKDIILVEGIFDAIRVCSAGLNVMILLGTNIFQNEIDYIRLRGLNPILMLDADVKYQKYKDFQEKLGRFEIIEVPKEKDDPSELTIEEVKELYKQKKEFGIGTEMRIKLNGSHS
jgi:hypothetical protein